MLSSEDIIKTKEHIKVMQAFLDGKEIESIERFAFDTYKTVSTPTWNFEKYKYKISDSEPEYKYPIYKQSKHGVVVQFTGLNTGTYVKKTVSYNVGEEVNDLVEHTCKEYWEDYDPKNDVFE